MSHFNPYRLGAIHLLKLLSHLPWAAKENEQKTYLKLLRKIVCYNQGKIADYAFSTNESHKKLKECYQRILDKQDTANDKDYDALQSAYQDISIRLIQQFKGYAKKNFEFMAEFCELKNFNNKKARFCVKSATIKDQEYIILPIAGSVPLTNNVAYSANESTGFSSVLHTGNYFLCNNIPERVKARKYNNSRIKKNQVLDFYKLSGWRKNLGYRFGNKKDNSWIRCWENGNLSQQTTEPSAFYKSTLVVPLSLFARPGDLSDTFMKNFEVCEDKIVLGFLCLDHENIDFFNHKTDVDFAYIIADHLSLYWVHYSICTNQSRIFQKSHDLLEKNNRRTA